MNYILTHQGFTVSKLWKIFAGLTCKLLFSVTVISDDYKSFISNKITFTEYCLTQWIFKAPQELWNLLSKGVPGKFHGSGGHNKQNCLQDRADSHMSRAWQNILVFNTGVT